MIRLIDLTSQTQQANSQDPPQVPQNFLGCSLQLLSQLLGSGYCGNLISITS